MKRTKEITCIHLYLKTKSPALGHIEQGNQKNGINRWHTPSL
jgi:hypothetical protein